jgi:exodeoxyribonuclease V beta subunit
MTTSAPEPQALDPLTMPLAGLQVIEASAGTGKTWTLAALYVRLVLGHGRTGALYPPQILVMTFTDAATAELRGRVRERLAQVALFFKDAPGAQAAADPFLRGLRAAYPADAWPACAQRLDLAAQWMDDAAIYTIHGWSSRMLKSHAFDSASLFQQSRVEDSDALRLSAVQDYWRHWFYAVPLRQLGALQALGADPDALLGTLKRVWAKAERAPGEAAPVDKDPHAWLQEWDAWQAALLPLETAAQQACTDDVRALLEATIAAKQLKGYLKTWPGKLAEWAQGESLLQMKKAAREKAQTLLQRFATSTLQDKGWSEAASHAAFGHVQALHQHLQAEPEVAEGLLQHAAQHIATAYTKAKAEQAAFDFSDLLQCLYRALQAPDGRLAAAIRQQYPVALVDEFQDTDAWQYGALSKIYGESARGDTGLLMIGDPKQAIYSFRGADLQTYLEARQQAQGIYTLAGNYRSTQAVVAALNHVFGSAIQPFGEVTFEPVEACNSKVQPVLVQGAEQPALTVWHLSAEARTKPPRKAVFQTRMAALFASQMVRLLNARAAAPGDMAVLVRSGAEARAMRQALGSRGVRSVYLSERDSVFATQEALDLWRLLCAVASPRSTPLVRAALGTRLWGLPFAELEGLLQNEAAWDAVLEQFHGWQTVWQRQGVLPMLHRLLHDQGIPARLLNVQNATDTASDATPDKATTAIDGERRLTNLMHVGELLQTASAGLQGEAALIRYLEQQLHHPKASGDSAQLRLESDAQLVQVITIHKSKGLQYPLVFLPFVSGYQTEKKDSGTSEAERLAEDLRLLYVAMTRAERGLWLGLTPYRGDLDGKTPQVKSAVSRLLRRAASGDLLERLNDWATCPHIVVNAAPEPDTVQYLPDHPVKHWKPALQPQRKLQSRWWTASFSALTRDLGQAISMAPNLATERDARIDDALIDNAMVDSAVWAESEAAASQPLADLPRYNAFPAGSSYGTLLHDLLEWQFEHGWPLADVAAGQQAAAAVPAEWAALLARKTRRLKLDAVQTVLLSDWLRHIVQAALPLPPLPPSPTFPPLPPVPGPSSAIAPASLQLAKLDRSCAWAEMSFTLPVHALSANRLDALISHHVLPGQERRPLQPLQLEGMLIGFMDLVLEHDGRYFVLDYKSNRLASYETASLQTAILEHRYDVQYTLYTLALHRLLKSRLSGYDYDRHVGGALYLFLRGIDQPGSGLLADRPPKALIEALDAACAQAAPRSEALP